MKYSNDNIKASDHESHTSMTILAFFIPVVGFVLGIVYLAKSELIDRKLGEHMVVLSILGTLLAGIAYYYLIPMTISQY